VVDGIILVCLEGAPEEWSTSWVQCIGDLLEIVQACASKNPNIHAQY
jgi:hypothetical protein